MLISNYYCCTSVHTENIDCSTAQKNIKKNYNELTYLPINSILGKLYSKEIITFKEKEMIESMPTQSKRMVYFLDEVIIRSLAVDVNVKFRRFIEVMMESGDPTLTSMAAKLIKYVSYYYCNVYTATISEQIHNHIL